MRCAPLRIAAGRVGAQRDAAVVNGGLLSPRSRQIKR
jgi:hypothetical protein